VSFTTMNEINADDVIRIVFPAGFVVNRADSATCPASSTQSSVMFVHSQNIFSLQLGLSMFFFFYLFSLASPLVFYY
jgi:hypothetical protein